MCQKYIFYHLCGHPHHSKILKCTEAIQRQLGFTNLGDEKDSETASEASAERMSPVQLTRSKESIVSCEDQLESPEIKLKPTLCDACEKIDMISSWVNNNSGIRYQMVKEWSNNKHWKARREVVDGRGR